MEITYNKKNLNKNQIKEHDKKYGSIFAPI